MHQIIGGVVLALLPATALLAEQFQFSERVAVPSSVLAVEEGHLFLHPRSIDLDLDGDMDLITGIKDLSTDQAGYIASYENRGGTTTPDFQYSGLLEANGATISVDAS